MKLSEQIMITKGKEIPTYEELEVQEVELSTPFLKAGSFHLGKQCEAENNVRVHFFKIQSKFMSIKL